MFILFAVAGGCNYTPEMQAFDKFKKHIPYVKLPYKASCNDTTAGSKFDVSDSMLKKYAPEGTTGIVGKIKDTDNYTAILYIVHGDMNYPVIQTTNPEGTKLNDIGLVSGTCCGSGNNCSGESWGQITKDLKVTLRDSEKVFEKDSATKLYSKIKFRNINTTELYQINDSGYIRILNHTNSVGSTK